MNSVIKDRANIIIAKLYFNHIEINDILSWTKFVRSCGIKSSKIDLILNKSIKKEEEIIRLFLELKKELKIKTTNQPEYFYTKYALYIAVQYLYKELSAKMALKKILAVIQESKDKDKYLGFVIFCTKHDILSRNLKFKNHDILNSESVLKELDSIFLNFAERSHDLRLRIQLNKRSTKQLVYARYFDQKEYNKLSLLIIDDILSKKGLSKDDMELLLEESRLN